jgi:hypothetical protein
MSKSLGVNVDWVKHLKASEDQQSFVDTLSGSPVVERLKEILKSRLKDRAVFKEVDYINPSWAYAAADRNGYVRAINEILSLLEIKSHQQ